MYSPDPLIDGQDIQKFPEGNYVKGTASNGMKFEGWINPESSELSTFFPVFEWTK